MDFFRRERLLFWLVIVLMLLNVALAASFWLKKPPFPPRGPGGRGGKRIMEEKLQLSEAQGQQFEQIRNDHFTRNNPLQERVHAIRIALLDEIFAVEPNEATIAALCAEIGQMQCQVDQALFNHFSDLKNVCKEGQVEELKNMLANLLASLHESRRPPDPRQPPPGPEGGPGPGHPPPPPGFDGGAGPGHPPLPVH